MPPCTPYFLLHGFVCKSVCKFACIYKGTYVYTITVNNICNCEYKTICNSAHNNIQTPVHMNTYWYSNITGGTHSHFNTCSIVWLTTPRGTRHEQDRNMRDIGGTKHQQDRNVLRLLREPCVRHNSVGWYGISFYRLRNKRDNYRATTNEYCFTMR